MTFLIICLFAGIGILIFTVCYLHKAYHDTLQRLQKERESYRDLSERFDQLQEWIDPDNSIYLWNKYDNNHLGIIHSFSPDRRILINGRQLQDVYSNSIPIDKAELLNNQYDGLYRDHINDLRDIALKFHNTQQLRANIANSVLTFRGVLNQKQKVQFRQDVD